MSHGMPSGKSSGGVCLLTRGGELPLRPRRDGGDGERRRLLPPLPPVMCAPLLLLLSLSTLPSMLGGAG